MKDMLHIARLLMNYADGTEIVCRVYLESADDEREIPARYWASWSFPSLDRHGQPCYRATTTDDHDNLADCLADAARRIQRSPHLGIEDGDS